MKPRIQSLEAHAYAAGRAFAYEEADFEPRYVQPARQGRLVAVALAAGASFVAMMHYFGLTGALSGWRGAA